MKQSKYGWANSKSSNKHITLWWKKILYVLPKLIKPRVCCISTSTEIQTENKYQVPISWKSNKALNWGIKAQNWPAMGVIEVNFQTTKKMNRLGSGFDLCTLTKKRIIHWVAANKEQRKTQLISLSINRCAALNHLVVTQYFYLPFFLSLLSFVSFRIWQDFSPVALCTVFGHEALDVFPAKKRIMWL